MSSFSLRRVALSSAAALLLGTVALPALADGNASECTSAGNVWVHVEHGDVVKGACATKFSNGTEAMVSTGLAEAQGDWVKTVDGVTADGVEWWSLWTGKPGSAWEFAQVGIDAMKPEAGTAIGWRLLPDYNVQAEAPKVNPFLPSTGN
ncbi:MAG TPA: hypothetical protein K8V15_11150 [Tessaracoccus flavescens]|uniref:Uncharacterized protein n=1 Tax=Tessaracoccus flavescens TaxID=399497 RepID=A0A921ERR3_9ACTN|nr:hypothetical protein [Tessaracoccus flavescens]